MAASSTYAALMATPAPIECPDDPYALALLIFAAIGVLAVLTGLIIAGIAIYKLGCCCCRKIKWSFYEPEVKFSKKKEAENAAQNKALMNDDGKTTCSVCKTTISKDKANQAVSISKQTALSRSLWYSSAKDFVISVQGCYIQAHKFVLSHRSPVFALIFHSANKEEPLKGMKIEEFSADVVEAGIKFIYDINVFDDITTSRAKSLLEFAHKYEILDLKNDIESYLITLISPTNSKEFDVLSIKCNARGLEFACKEMEA